MGEATGQHLYPIVDSPASTSTDEVVRLADMQDFDGFWQLNNDLANLFKLTKSQLSSVKPADGKLNIPPFTFQRNDSLLTKFVIFITVTDETIWATVLVIAYLRTEMAARHDEWDMVVQKALEWLKEEKKCSNAEGLIENAVEALKKLLLEQN